MIYKNWAAEMSSRCGHSLLGGCGPDSQPMGGCHQASLCNSRAALRNGRFWENPRLVPIPS